MEPWKACVCSPCVCSQATLTWQIRKFLQKTKVTLREKLSWLLFLMAPDLPSVKFFCVQYTQMTTSIWYLSGWSKWGIATLKACFLLPQLCQSSIYFFGSLNQSQILPVQVVVSLQYSFLENLEGFWSFHF